MKKYCKHCKRLATHKYRNEELCDLHYLLSNPKRNISWVNYAKVLRIKNMSIEDRKKLDEIKRKYDKGEVLK